jgi:hypothetical protein
MAKARSRGAALSGAKAQAVSKATENMKVGQIVIKQPEILSLVFEIVGTSPLIQNNFSQKSVEQMLAKHMGINVPRENKKPRELIERAKILNEEGRVCIPPAAFKKGMLSAAAQIKTLKKTHLRPGIFIEGQSIPITYDRFIPRMDIVRTAGIGRQPDVRFRPSFDGWRARLIVQFSDAFHAQSIVDLLNRAGRIGVGEWRPEKDGVFGTYRIERSISDQKEVAEVRAECDIPLVSLKIPDWALDAEIDPETLQKLFQESADDGGPGEEVKDNKKAS